LDTLHRTELRTFAAREAQVYVHERDLARAPLLLADLVGERHLGNAFFLESPFDDVNGIHGSIHPSPLALLVSPPLDTRTTLQGDRTHVDRSPRLRNLSGALSSGEREPHALVAA